MIAVPCWLSALCCVLLVYAHTCEFFYLLLLVGLDLFWGECVLYCSGCVLFFVSALVHFVIVRSFLFPGMKKPSPVCESWGGSFLVALDQS